MEEAINKLENIYFEKKYDNNSNSTQTIVPKSEKRRIKSVRKITEKTLKTLNMKLSDISKEVLKKKILFFKIYIYNFLCIKTLALGR
jgi:hypothetical protein